MNYYIAIDIGGTRMRAGAYPAEGYKPIAVEKIATKEPGSTFLERIVQLIERVSPEGKKITSIGVAAPGPTNPKTGIVYHAPNIPELRYFPLVDYLQDKTQTPVFIDNDANLAAVGEWKAGAGLGHNHLIYLTISTGIGGGIISDGLLLHGVHGLASELGHITVLPDGPLCSCGKRGHLESIASGPSITRWVKEEISNGIVSSLSNTKNLSAKIIAEAAKQGDELALTAFNRAGHYIGLALANFLHTFNPSIIIIGGGVSLSGDLLLDPIKESLQAQIFDDKYMDNLTITTAALGDDAGMIGALLLARNAIRK